MKSPTTYAVREAEPRSVASDVARIWQENLTLAMDSRARCDWVYEAAPDPPARVLVLDAAIAGADPVIVGTAGIARRRFQVGTEQRSAGHLVDLAVAPAHRALGPALSLVREGRRLALVGHDFAYGFPNAKARGVFRRAGYAALGPVTRFARVLRHRPYLERYLGATPLASAGGVLLDRALSLWLAPRRLRTALLYRLDLADEPDARFDELWQRCKCEYDVVSWRGAALLRWRFLGGHRGRRRFATLTRRGEARVLAAYAVVETQGTTAHIRDLFGDKASLGPLLDLLLPRLRADGASSASFMCLASAEIGELLRSRGFSPREQERVLFYDSASAELARTLANPERWYVTDLDDDS